ncbi:uncharacterized protein LOC112086667 [Eutrema salsugineum]|uniref:uncharacterized protein LOC112086667 n=1 Tax=Eutrema salsugineum TaxID=72664 RepID=UPI000CED3E60|nr:uncharacterized protein LOC112086667 [Eutrema salsugineum]
MTGSEQAVPMVEKVETMPTVISEEGRDSLAAEKTVVNKVVSAKVGLDKEDVDRRSRESSPSKESADPVHVHAKGVELEKGKSWSAVVADKARLRKYDVVVENEEGEDTIVGKFVSAAPHVGYIHMTVNKIWTSGDKSLKIDVFVVDDTTVQFKIPDASTRSQVLRRGMWSIKNILMMVSKWSPVVEEAQPAIQVLPMWVNFEEARVFVEVNLDQKLPESFSFKSKTGVDTVVQYEFPWLPPRCVSCAKWGHTIAECKAQPGDKRILQRSSPVKVGNTNAAKEIDRLTVHSAGEKSRVLGVELPGKSVAKEGMGNAPGGEVVTVAPLGKQSEGRANGSVDMAADSTESLTDSFKTFAEAIWQEVKSPASRRGSPKVGDVEDIVSTSRFASLDQEEGEIDESAESVRLETEPENELADSKVVAEKDPSNGGRVQLPRGSKSALKVVKPIDKPASNSSSPKNSGKKTRKRDLRAVSTSGMWDFQDLVRDGDLSDMGYHGPLFTWGNKRNEGLVCKKLDRVLINDHWLNGNSRSYSQPEFQSALRDYWGDTTPLFHSTSALYRFSKKLKNLKPVVRHFSRESLHDISKKVRANFELLCQKQEQTLSNPSELAQQEESEACLKWEKSVHLEEMYLAQKAKLNWLQHGDKNTKVFHRAVKVRAARNGIRELQSVEGTVIKDANAIKAEAVRHFDSFMNHRPDDLRQTTIAEMRGLLKFRCCQSDQRKLVAEVTAEEIKRVLFEMPANKSPRPNGYTVEFFKDCWSIVGQDLVVAIQSFFSKGFLPKGVNSTILALIPKKDQALFMKDYRPIACCNVIYKIVSKILANRLKTLLPQFILPNQSAFVKDRLLLENLLLASELVAGYHKKSVSSRCALKIDISKAFDSVEWSFLLTVLEAMDLPQGFIHWIRLCVSSASFSVQVNGELAGYFNSSRGLRQGCSLSPYLYVICMNVLSHMLDKAAVERKYGFHPKCSTLKLTHLCFADDIMIFSDGKLSSMEGIVGVFEDFAKMSGLQISMEKSTAFLAGVSEADRQTLGQRYRFEQGELPVRYLGLPLLTKKMKSLDYAPLIDKIRTRFNSWTARQLSFAGRLQLVSSVIASLVNFWMQAFRLPKGCLDKIDILSSAFLWSGPDLKPRKAKIAWSEVCKSKQDGGLGLKNLAVANDVCILKLFWRIVTTKQSLWVRWTEVNLMRDGSVWLTPPPTTQSTGSWMWKQILHIRHLAEAFLRVRVGNGRSALFWYDNWSSLGNLLNLFGARGCVDLGIPHTATVEDAILSHRRRRHRVQKLNEVEDELEALRRRYQQTEDDTFLWKSKVDLFKTIFSAKATRDQLISSSKVPWAEGIWFKHHSPKFGFMAWLALHNRLSTGDRMQQWNPNISVSCALCQAPLESRDHLFFSCPFSMRIWTTVAKGIMQQEFTTDWTTLVTLISRR